MSSDAKTKLLNCPFCGVQPDAAEAHTSDCFFKLRQKLSEPGVMDARLSERVAEAWQRRHAHAGYKLLPTTKPADFARLLRDLEANGTRLSEINPDRAFEIYTQVVAALDAACHQP